MLRVSQKNSFTSNGRWKSYTISPTKDCYASDLIKELKESKMIVVEGTLYPLLTRQKNAGLLKYRWEDSTQGPPRKYYSLTEKGEEFLKELDTSWKELVAAVDLINKK